MNHDIDNMSEKELLAELVRQGRRVEKADMIKTCVLAVLLVTILVLALVCVPKILAPIRQISASMEEIESGFDEAKRVLSDIDEDTVEQFRQTMESMNEASQQLRAFMDKLRESGLDKLPSALEGLNNSLGRFAKFFGG